jgi:NitT/TauT family transport system permease protein
LSLRLPVGSRPDLGAATATVRSPALGDFLLRGAFLLALLAVWQLAFEILVLRFDLWSPALFPSPARVGRWLWDGFGLSFLSGDYRPLPGQAMPNSFWQAVAQAEYPAATLVTLGRLVQGYAIALLIGVPLGLTIARSSLSEKTVGWLAVALQGLPSICWVPLALLWFGRTGINGPILFVTVMGAVFATAITIADGVRNVPPLLARAGRNLGASGLALYTRVLIPAALPGIISGLKVGWAFAWRSLMAAEIVVYSGGLGFLLHRDREYGDTPGVVASIIIVVLLGSLIQNTIFGPLEARVRARWGLSGTRS